MTRYQFDLAEPRDDAALREVMAQTPMPGSITLSFQREPSYFDSNRVLGPSRQTIVCRDTDRGEIVGMATRSVRDLYVGGELRPVGYLGALRSVEHARNRGQLARGYRFLKELHDADPHAPDYYLTTIAQENRQVMRILTSGRAGLPNYHPLGRLHTLVLPVGRHRDKQRRLECSPPESLDELIGFLNTVGPERTFFPAYTAADFEQTEGTFSGLRESSTVVLRRDGRIVAAAGLWDQRPFRQTTVSGYSWPIPLLRPLQNAWARLTGGVALPRTGTPLPACFVSFPVVAGGEEPALPQLLNSLMQRAPGDTRMLLLGLCENDPLLPAARALGRSEYTTLLYAVNWTTLPESIVGHNSTPYYLELGCL